MRGSCSRRFAGSDGAMRKASTISPTSSPGAARSRSRRRRPKWPAATIRRRSVGPFARLRPGAQLAEQARVGNFVELKKTVLGKGSKASHLTYLGDAVIGEGCNIGAGTITCNYDGQNKHVTTIEDGAFIGSDTQLVAPVTVHKGAYVGSGTTVREDVPPGALTVSVGKQRNIEGWGA